jgi:hypothetical protein
MSISQYDVVRVIRIRDARFDDAEVFFQRHPRVGDIGAVVEVYTNPIGFEVECCAAGDGITTWLDAMYPEELELVVKHAV